MESEIRDWLMQFASAVQAVDYSTARNLFALEVIGFGTVADRAEGLDDLAAHQWQRVWGVTRGFHFLEDKLVCRVAGNTAWVAAGWASEGAAPGGAWFDRRGRATIVLDRRDGRWLAVHTHLSFTPNERSAAGGPA